MQISIIVITTILVIVNLDMNADSNTIRNYVKKKSVEKKCRFRHKKSCTFGIKCKFFQRKVCSYKHIDKKNDASENLTKEIQDLEMDVKKLKRCIESKEIKLNKKAVEKDESVTNFLSKIKDQSEVIAELAKGNL